MPHTEKNIVRSLKLTLNRNDFIQVISISLLALIFCFLNALHSKDIQNILTKKISSVNLLAIDSLNFDNGPIEISTDFAFQFYKNKTGIFIDCRTEKEYQKNHIPSAINISYNQKNLVAQIQKFCNTIPLDTLLITYCDELNCNKSYYVTLELLDNGFERICILKDGWQGWQEIENISN